MMAMLPSSRRNNEAVARYITTRAAVEATLGRTEAIIDELTSQVRRRAPQVSHVTIEVEGLSPPPAETSEDTQ